MMLKAKPTEYNYYNFRSRLEARWAYFFNLLGIDYRYELQTYELGNINYLPDFWLPTLEDYVEIKGYTPDKVELRKGSALCLASMRPVYIFVGDPFGVSEFHYFLFQKWDSSYIGTMSERVEWGLNNVWEANEDGYTEYYVLPSVPWICLWGNWTPETTGAQFLIKDPRFQGDRRALLSAQIKARQARFEYGETPELPPVKPLTDRRIPYGGVIGGHRV